VNEPFFSIILPTYNRARMARTALRTVQWQTSGDWECWIVDDGSTDDTQSVLAEFRADARFRFITRKENKGMNASRNEAISQAKGRFITFLDSDDLWLPRRLEAFRARAERDPGAGFLFSNAYVWRFDRMLGLLFDPARAIPEGVVPGQYGVGDRELPYVTTNLALRRDFFDKYGLFRTEMKTLDTELFTRFLAHGLPVAAIREPLSVRRIHSAQLTDRAFENFEENMQALGSSGASPEVRNEIRLRIAHETAGYMVKAGQPREARELLTREFGKDARPALLYAAAFVPAWALNAARALRRAWLVARHHPAWAPGALREISRLIEPLLKEERADKK